MDLAHGLPTTILELLEACATEPAYPPFYTHVRPEEISRRRCVEAHHAHGEVGRTELELPADQLTGKAFPAASRQHAHRARPARRVLDDSHVRHAAQVQH